jgi:transposase
MDLRERILSSYDNGEGTRDEIAHRFRVSLGMVKKLLQQRRRTGDIAPRHHLAGRKPMIVAAHQSRIRALLAKKNDLTLKELREALGLKCSVQAIHVVLGRMELTYKKRRSAPASRTAPIGRETAEPGGGGRPASTRHD